MFKSSDYNVQKSRLILPTDIWDLKDLIDVTVTLSNGEKK